MPFMLFTSFISFIGHIVHIVHIGYIGHVVQDALLQGQRLLFWTIFEMLKYVGMDASATALVLDHHAARVREYWSFN